MLIYELQNIDITFYMVINKLVFLVVIRISRYLFGYINMKALFTFMPYFYTEQIKIFLFIKIGIQIQIRVRLFVFV